MSTAPKNASQVRTDKEHGGLPVLGKPMIFKNKKHKKRFERSRLKRQNARRIYKSRHDRTDQKTGVDMHRPEKPPKSVVTQPDPKDFRKRSGFVDLNKISLTNQTGESLRKLKFRIGTLSRSKSQIQGSCNPLYRLRKFFKRKVVEFTSSWELQKITNLLVGGLVFTKYPVGVLLSGYTQLMVAPINPTIVRRIVSCLPFWPTSYTMPVLHDIASILKRVCARHRSMRL